MLPLESLYSIPSSDMVSSRPTSRNLNNCIYWLIWPKAYWVGLSCTRSWHVGGNLGYHPLLKPKEVERKTHTVHPKLVLASTLKHEQHTLPRGQTNAVREALLARGVGGSYFYNYINATYR